MDTESDNEASSSESSSTDDETSSSEEDEEEESSEEDEESSEEDEESSASVSSAEDGRAPTRMEMLASKTSFFQRCTCLGAEWFGPIGKKLVLLDEWERRRARKY
jgi:hypothetical protein